MKLWKQSTLAPLTIIIIVPIIYLEEWKNIPLRPGKKCNLTDVAIAQVFRSRMVMGWLYIRFFFLVGGIYI